MAFLRPRRRKRPNTVTLGIDEDFCNFFSSFESVQDVRYDRFANIWRQMKLSLISSGRQNEREAREFIEECLRIAVQYWLPPSSFQIQIGALYLLYGLYFTQPCWPKVCIRLLPDQWVSIIKFHDRLKAEKHHDAEYVFLRLYISKAFHFVAITQEINLRNRSSTDDGVKVSQAPGSHQPLIDSSHLDCLEAYHKAYSNAKDQLAGEDSSQPNSSLDFIDKKFIANLHSIVEQHKEDVGNKEKKSLTNEMGNEISDEEIDSLPPLFKGRRKKNTISNEKLAKAGDKRSNLSHKNESFYTTDVDVKDLGPVSSSVAVDNVQSIIDQAEMADGQLTASNESSQGESAKKSKIKNKTVKKKAKTKSKLKKNAKDHSPDKPRRSRNILSNSS